MLPSTLVSTYQQYKLDTDSVAAWLASTAKSLGYPPDLLASESSSSPSSSRRLKGKARANAKKQAATATGAGATPMPATPSAAKGPKYTIRISSFISLAEYIAGKAKPVPAPFRATLDRVIAARSGFGGQLEQHGKLLDEQSDAKHQHFVGVLEKVRELLRPFMPAVGDADKAEESQESLANRFTGLTVYEPSKEFLDLPDVERPARAENDDAIYEAQSESSLEAAVFALTALLNDLGRVRARVRSIWANFKSGALDVCAAAIATDTAIGLARGMMDEVQPLLDRNGGVGKMLQAFHLLQCLEKGLEPDEVFPKAKPAPFSDNFNYDTYDLADGSYIVPYRMLSAFIPVLGPHNNLPMIKDGIFGEYDPRSDRSSKSGTQKWEDDRALLMPFLAQLATAIRGARGKWPISDEFMRGVDELDRTKQVPFYAAFAAQVFLDVTYELGEHVERPFQQFHDQGRFMENDIDEHFGFHADLKIGTWPASNDRSMRGLQGDLRWLLNDPLHELVSRMRVKLGVPPLPEDEKNRLFRMSPVASGLALFRFRQLHREVGLGVADAWGSVQYCQHLYNAARSAGLVSSKCVWEDMEVCYANQGAAAFYVGAEAPEAPEACFKKFCLQMGTSAAAMTGFIKGRRARTSLASSAGPRGLKDQDAAPVSAVFKARYVDGSSGGAGLAADYVERIIELSLYEKIHVDGDGAAEIALSRIEDPKALQEKKKKRSLAQNQNQNTASSRASQSGGGHAHRLTPDRLVERLALALQAESLELAFPYLSFHRCCWLMLRMVKQHCDPLLRQLYTPAYIEAEHQLPWVVGWTLMAAASGSHGAGPDRRPLEKAAEVFEVFAASGTNRFLIDKVLQDQFGIPIEFEVEIEE